MPANEPELQANRVFVELERAARRANAAHISDALGAVSFSSLEQAADYAARLRAAYLSEVVGMASRPEPVGSGTCDPTRLRRLREAYEEALLGFEALKRALERGYLAVEGAPSR
jgi:hypothetical protein